MDEYPQTKKNHILISKHHCFNFIIILSIFTGFFKNDKHVLIWINVFMRMKIKHKKNTLFWGEVGIVCRLLLLEWVKGIISYFLQNYFLDAYAILSTPTPYQHEKSTLRNSQFFPHSSHLDHRDISNDMSNLTTPFHPKDMFNFNLSMVSILAMVLMLFSPCI